MKHRIMTMTRKQREERQIEELPQNAERDGGKACRYVMGICTVE
jgi:hypothetical protein